MPKLKIDHVVSFSTEDPIHVANNILLGDSTKKWKCSTEGEKLASVVLQLEKASVITGIDIGNEHSAYVEVLVSRSGATDDFKVLLVMSSFMSPLDSRQSSNINKVRMFTTTDLQTPERDQKWDRVKIVCTQPFNRHVQYGLSFVNLHTTENKCDTTSNSSKLGNFSIRPASPDNLTTGSLFAKRKELDNTPSTVATAIHKASLSGTLPKSSQQFKKHLEETRTTSPIQSKLNTNSDTPKPRNRDELLYNKDEEDPHKKIDKLIAQNNKEIEEKKVKKTESHKLTPSSSSRAKTETSPKKRKTTNTQIVDVKKKKIDIKTKPFGRLLENVTIVISGIQNPERSNIRSNALKMGAKYKSDWDNSCTHLICAFTNTPKYNQVKGKGKIVNKNWVLDCYSKRKRLPWRRYALSSKEQSKPESEDEIFEETKKSPVTETVYNRSNDEENASNFEDVNISDTENKIERIQADNKHGSGFSDDTEEDVDELILSSVLDSPPPLPDYFSNKLMYIDEKLSNQMKMLLTQYIVAYDGTIVENINETVDYIISSENNANSLKDTCPKACIVNTDWIWECHNKKMLASTTNFEL